MSNEQNQGPQISLSLAPHPITGQPMVELSIRNDSDAVKVSLSTEQVLALSTNFQTWGNFLFSMEQHFKLAQAQQAQQSGEGLIVPPGT